MSLKTMRARALAITAVGASTLAMAPAAQAVSGPTQKSFFGAFTYSLANGAQDAPGANNWACKPKTGQLPVVLVHGTWENAYSNFAYLSPALKSVGTCVFALNYGGTTGLNGTGPVKAAAVELSAFVDKVIAATGSPEVDVVGHSQGGMMPRAYIKWQGGAAKIRNLVTLGATHKGTTLHGIGTLGKELQVLGAVGAVAGQAAADQVQGSAFMNELNAGGQMTAAGVRYTAIVTKYDEVTTPYTNGYITGNAARAEVFNINLQGNCGTNFADHLSMTYSVRAFWYIRQALNLPRSSTPPCDVQLPLF